MMDQWIYTADAIVALFSGLVAVKVDGDKEPGLVKQYSVGGYPTMILLSPEGKEIRRAAGESYINKGAWLFEQ